MQKWPQRKIRCWNQKRKECQAGSHAILGTETAGYDPDSVVGLRGSHPNSTVSSCCNFGNVAQPFPVCFFICETGRRTSSLLGLLGEINQLMQVALVGQCCVTPPDLAV